MLPYKQLKEIENQILICFNNEDMESLEEITIQALGLYRNNITSTS
jgi:hypothetical protein